MSTEKEKYIDWFKKEQEKSGLIYCKPILNIDPLTGKSYLPDGTTEEDVYRAMNEMNAAFSRGEFREINHL